MYVYEFSGGSTRGRFESMIGKSCQQREGMLDRDPLAGQHGERITIIINEGSADIYRRVSCILAGILTTARPR